MRKITIILTVLTIICILFSFFSIFPNFSTLCSNLLLLSELNEGESVTSVNVDGTYIVKLTREAIYRSVINGIVNILRDLTVIILSIIYNIIIVKLYKNNYSIDLKKKTNIVSDG